MVDDSPNSKQSESVQKVVHVHKNVRHNSKGFEVFGIPITFDTIQMLITGGIGAISIGMLISEIQRRKRDEGTNQMLAQLQTELNDLRENRPNVELQQQPASPPQQPQAYTVEQRPPNYVGDSSMYYDYINNVDDNAVNDVNLNTIKPFMDNVTDRAANIQQQQMMYQQQRQNFEYNVNGNPAKSQHMTTRGDTGVATMPTSQYQNPQTANTVSQQPPQQQQNNSWIGRDGVVRKQSPRPEIQINMA